MSVRAARGSVRLRWMLRLLVSARRFSSVSSFASACQLPDTSSSIANSVPRLAMRLSLMLPPDSLRSEEHTSELQSRVELVCRLLREKKQRLTLAVFLVTAVYLGLSFVTA